MCQYTGSIRCATTGGDALQAGGVTMDAATLKTLQAPLKEAYRDTPEKAFITLRAKGSIED